MLKNLLNNLFGGNNTKKEVEFLKQQNEMLMNEIRKNNTKVVCNSQGMDKTNIDANLEVSVDVDYTDKLGADIRGINYNTVDFNKASDEVRYKMKSELRDDIFDGGIENVIATCEKYPTELLQQYLVSLMCANGTYHPENFNIDSLTREYIIASIDEISFDNFKVAMKVKGFEVNPPSKAQLDKLKELGFTGTVRTSLGASQLIQSVVGKADTKPSDKQIERINALIQRLNYQGEDTSYNTKFEASKVIEHLQKIADETLGAEKASESQIRYYGQLLQSCNKRLTKDRKAFAHSCSKAEISKAIEELKIELKEKHPEVSKGQVDYLVSLHQSLMLPYNIDELKKLTKEEGTKLIEKLNADVLYMETRRYQASMTMADIKKMSSTEVSAMIKQIRADRKDQRAV